MSKNIYPFVHRSVVLCGKANLGAIGPCVYPWYPRSTTETLVSCWWFERLPQRGLSGGSKYRAYIRARGASSRASAYLGQYYRMFAGPVGMLP